MLVAVIGALIIGQERPQISVLEQTRSAVAVLQECGMPEIKGLPFHKVELVLFKDELSRPVYTRDKFIESYGWILPISEGEKLRAVSLDGIVREVKADFGQVDIDLAISNREQGSPFWRDRTAYPGLIGLEASGRSDLVDLVADSFRKYPPAGTFIEGGLVATYFKRIYNRAVGYYMTGDNAEALRLLAQVLKWQAIRAEEFSATGKARYSGLHEDISRSVCRLAGRLYRGVSDRVYRSGVPDPELNEDLLADSDQYTRVQQMVSQLHSVKPRAFLVPGGAFFQGDPIFDALVAEGQGAVYQLLNAIDNLRPIRVSYQRFAGSLATVYTVGDLASRAIWRINRKEIKSLKDAPFLTLKIGPKSIEGQGARPEALKDANGNYYVLSGDADGTHRFITVAIWNPHVYLSEQTERDIGEWKTEHGFGLGSNFSDVYEKIGYATSYARLAGYWVHIYDWEYDSGFGSGQFSAKYQLTIVYKEDRVVGITMDISEGP
ncbi:MAG: hypothetical protein IH944_06365 [Armatimonadetes bacterium]|nr:hypothetical protein [Armatimonadota bacterium]